MPSKRFQLNRADLVKIGTGALIAAGGAALTYIAEALPGVDFGEWTPMVVAISSVLINAARKWLTERE